MGCGEKGKGTHDAESKRPSTIVKAFAKEVVDAGVGGEDEYATGTLAKVGFFVVWEAIRAPGLGK